MNGATLIRRQAAELNWPGEIHPLLRRIYNQRNLPGAEAVELGLANLLPPDLLKGMDEAVELLLSALREQWKVLLVGDYDADGATSCVVAIDALHSFGFDHLDYIVPNRFEYGYGLTPAIVELAAARDPDLLITVDNGISSIDGVQAAREAGLRTLITDHHLPGLQLPAAEAHRQSQSAGLRLSGQAYRRRRRDFLRDAGLAPPPAGTQLVRAGGPARAQSRRTA